LVLAQAGRDFFISLIETLVTEGHDSLIRPQPAKLEPRKYFLIICRSTQLVLMNIVC
jgi:hypothetical protein